MFPPSSRPPEDREVVLGMGCESSSGLLDPENEPPGESFDHPSYQILFISDRDGGSIMDADGSNPTNVSQNLGWDGSPKSNMMHRWTPDGRIVFDHQPSGEWWTYAVNPDGSDLEPMFNAWEKRVLGLPERITRALGYAIALPPARVARRARHEHSGGAEG